jgi:uncharacterized protein (TIGR00251 family)
MTSGANEAEAFIAVRIKPRASKTHIIGKIESKMGAAILIEIAAPPVSGKANAELLRFLAKRLGIPQTNLAIVSGKTSRDKLVRASGISSDEIERRLFPPK